MLIRVTLIYIYIFFFFKMQALKKLAIVVGSQVVAFASLLDSSILGIFGSSDPYGSGQNFDPPYKSSSKKPTGA